MNSAQPLNRKVNILEKLLYSPSLKNVAWLESFQLRFYFSMQLSIFFFGKLTRFAGKKRYLSERVTSLVLKTIDNRS